MKNSGIEWIGNIPNDWGVRRVKNCFYLSKTKAHQKDPVVLRLARSGVHVKDVTTNEGQMAESYEDYNPVCVGDLLLNPMDLYSGANCNVSEVEGVISPAYQNLRKKIELNPKYFDYYFKIQYWTMAMFAHGKGISFDNRWTINSETILNYYVPFPSLDEQNKIVLALNNKLSQVDELIANQEKQIEKLKEYKQSVITEAVTKGLDKSAPMKDSGIEWIGKIPAHWIKIKHKVLFKNVSIKGHGEATVLSLYRDYGVVPKDSRDDNHNVTSLDTDSYKYIQPNDLVINKMKAWSGSIAITDYEGIVSPAYYTCKVNYKYITKRFIHHYLRNKHLVGLYEMYSAGLREGQWDLSIDDFQSIEIAIPPTLEEQDAIAKFINEKCDSIDKLISIKQEKIEKLQEYKKSLIYEYVTGKKEVV